MELRQARVVEGYLELVVRCETELLIEPASLFMGEALRELSHELESRML